MGRTDDRRAKEACGHPLVLARLAKGSASEQVDCQHGIRERPQDPFFALSRFQEMEQVCGTADIRSSGFRWDAETVCFPDGGSIRRIPCGVFERLGIRMYSGESACCVRTHESQPTLAAECSGHAFWKFIGAMCLTSPDWCASGGIRR